MAGKWLHLSIKNFELKPFDVIRVLMPHPPFEYLLEPENIPINVIYEDDQLLVVNKEAGMVVHPGHGNYSGTLVNALAYIINITRMNNGTKYGFKRN